MNNQTNFIIKVWVIAGCFFFSGLPVIYALTTISSFYPASGPVGTLVTVTGTGLSGPTSFTIGGTAAIVVSGTGTSAVGMVMPGTSTGAISITTTGGTATSGTNFTVTATLYPSVQQGTKLTVTDAISPSYQGWSVSLSADGNTAIVGGPYDNSNIGAAWVYTCSGNSWIQQGSKLVGTGAIGTAKQGISVSLSADGNTAIVGGSNDNSGVGAAWVYTRSGNIWTQQGSKLVGTGAIGAAAQGNSVSLSADGNTAIVGGYNDNYDLGAVGAAWIFTRSGGIWVQQGGKLTGMDATANALQGYSVSLSADGNTAIVGGAGDNSSVGAAWVYTRSGNTWSQQGNKLAGADATGNANQGYSVSLSADGNTAIVGGTGDNSAVGAAWVYTRSCDAWSQQGNKLVGTGATGTSRQGSSVSLSADGNVAIVGGYGDNSNSGAAWVYTRDRDTWQQQGNKKNGYDATGAASQGRSVFLSADGTTAISGGNMDNSGIGASWIFIIRPSPTITSIFPAFGPAGTLVTITGTGLSNPSSFTIGGTPALVVSNNGSSLVGMVMPGAVTGNISVITPGGTATSGPNFTVTATPYPAFQQGDKLTGSGASGAAKQGYSVSLSADGNTAILGGPDDNTNIGAAWIYTRNGNIWTQQGNKLVGTGVVGQSYQGQSVCLSADGNTAIVGGNGDNNNVGAAWIFTRSGDTWSQQGSKLVGSGAIGAWQGWSVSISADGNTAIVGGPNDNGQVGAAWIYARIGNIWTQQGNKLVGTGAIGPSYQGWSVSLSADASTAIIGGYPDNNYVGAAWVFTRSGNTWTQQGNKLVGTGATGKACQGHSVSLSADGNTAIIGGVNDNNYIGAAWVFTRNGTTWTQQGAKLVGTGGIGQSSQGSSVSLSADGNTAVVGGPWDNSNVGAAWVYARTGNTWSQQGSKLAGTGTASLIRQGASVSLSANGQTAILGGYMDNGYLSAAWVFIGTPPPGITSFSPESGPVGTLVTVTGTGLSNPASFSIGGTPAIVVSGNGTSLVAMVMPGTYNSKISLTTAGGTATSQSNFTVTSTLCPSIQQGGKLTGTGVSGAANQGYSVSLSADGKTAIVGAPLDNSNVGAAWIYIRSGNTWTQQGSKLVGTGAIGAAKQGSSVSLSADGNTAIVGGYKDNNNAGAAWVFTRSGGIWSQQGSKIVGTGAIGNAYQGYSVSLSADGNTALVGGYSDNNNVGAAWVFSRVGTIWTQQGSKLAGTSAIGQSWQGSSVSLSADGNTAIVGGPCDNNLVGAAWVYARTGNTWTQQIKLAGTGANGQSKQGTSVSLSADGTAAIVGGHGDNNNIGAAWVYTRNGNTWTQQGNKLVGIDATTNAFQGQSVSLSADGNTAVVGGYRNNSNAGAAWVYTRIANAWTQCGSKLTGTGAIGLSGQGSSVSLNADGSTAIMGGYVDNSGIGAAWVFVTPPPALTSFSPDHGPAGTLVTITGTNLNLPVSFTFGGIPAIVVSNTGTSLVGMVMPGAAIGPASISITTHGGVTTSGSDFIVNPTPYPSSQQGNKLVGTGATGLATQGYSVSLSADGNTAIVGGHTDNSGIGAAWVYTRSGGIWSQQGSKLVGTGSNQQPQQGCSVSLSADGNTAIVGGRADVTGIGGVGAVWIFTRIGNTWAQQGNKIAGSWSFPPNLGHSVSLSADGNTAIAGGPNDNWFTGAAWVYTRIGNSWTLLSRLAGTGAIGLSGQGSSVSLSADGNTAIVGGPDDNSGVGAAWIYTRRGNNWIQQGPKLVGTGAIGQSRQGLSVSLSADGNTAIVGGFGDNGLIGAAWIFTRNDTTWTQQGNKFVADDATGTAKQGVSVSLSADGNTAIVGGQGDNSNAGAAWVYTRRGDTWTQCGSKLTGTGAIGQAWQGGSVSLSADGKTAILGGFYDNSNAGAAWVFKEVLAGNPLKASVSINADPAGAVSAGTPVTFTATPVNGGTPSYQWMKGKVAIPGETGPTYTSASLADKDTITVVMTSSLSDIAGNPATSNAIIVTFKTTAIGEIGNESLSDSQKFDVYPIPSDGLLKVTIHSPVLDTYSIQVCNSIGVKLYELKEIRVNGLTETNIDLRQATQGLYYVVFRSNQQQIVRKIIISR